MKVVCAACFRDYSVYVDQFNICRWTIFSIPYVFDLYKKCNFFSKFKYEDMYVNSCLRFG
jgi:hypothetical protein